jgi:hypothetical protein
METIKMRIRTEESSWMKVIFATLHPLGSSSPFQKMYDAAMEGFEFISKALGCDGELSEITRCSSPRHSLFLIPEKNLVPGSVDGNDPDGETLSTQL